MSHFLSKHDVFIRDCLHGYALNNKTKGAELPQTFGYIREVGANDITGNLSIPHIVEAFDDLVESMRTTTIQNGKADAGMTFFGQFVDHDITFDVQSAIGTKVDPRNIRNTRTPSLDLDCVYGDGLEASPHLYSNDAGMEGFMLMGREGSELDLARNCQGRALIGDPRNDENIIISQIQGSFIALHNILMTLYHEEGHDAKFMAGCAEMGIRSDRLSEITESKSEAFEIVRRVIRLHYQWIVLKEFLPSFVEKSLIEEVCSDHPFKDNTPIMPAEFTVGSYRFGHATVQPEYKLSKQGNAKRMIDLLGVGMRGPDLDIEMAQFFDVKGTRAQKARPVGTKMAEDLFSLPDGIVREPLNWGKHEIKVELAKKLGLRNILRDRSALRIASGQQLARLWGFAELPAPSQLKDKHIDKTPLWFYSLQEAEEKGDGKLTGVGGTVVAGVLIRLLQLDPESVLNTHDFEPLSIFGEKFTLGGLMQFVEKNRHNIKNRETLFCGPTHKHEA